MSKVTPEHLACQAIVYIRNQTELVAMLCCDEQFTNLVFPKIVEFCQKLRLRTCLSPRHPYHSREPTAAEAPNRPACAQAIMAMSVPRSAPSPGALNAPGA